jgi:uncharacterized protein YigE (DUF2233 family)
MEEMSAIAPVLGHRGRPADLVAVAALGAYALAVAILVVAPFRSHPSSRPPATPAVAVPSRGLPERAEHLTLAPQRSPTEAERKHNVSRGWSIIGGVGVDVVRVDPQAETVRVLVGLAKGTALSDGVFGRESFTDMVRRFHPRVAINGTYFHLRNNEPVGALVMDGRLVYDGISHTAVLIRESGKASIEYHPGRAMGRNAGWPRDVETALGSGPTLVRNGSVALNPYDEGFGDPSLFAQARRSALGVTADGKLLLVVVQTPITLNKLANVMLRLDAVDAMNLDGGGSTALYCDGRFIAAPTRPLTNLLLVYD